MTPSSDPQGPQTESWFRLIVEAAPNAILMVDGARTITLVNRSAESLFGYGRLELMGQPIELLIPQRLVAGHPIHVDTFFSKPSARPMGVGRELFGRRKDGSEVPIEIGLNPLESEHGLFTLASIIDISQRRRTEDELRRSNEDLEQFAYVASHDLQEPLRMVASYTELLADLYSGKLDERADKCIFYAADGAKRMQRLITDLLEYARVGVQSKALAPVSIAVVVQRVLRVLRAPVEQAGATIEVGTLPMVMADEGQLEQLLQNLVVNALKFRAAAPPRIAIQAKRLQERWEISVQDNGIGVETKYAGRIFQMFQRLHERGKYEGSGMGLAIAKRILDRHGGKIWCESEPGRGTTFFFTLQPALTETSLEAEEPAAPESARMPESVSTRDSMPTSASDASTAQLRSMQALAARLNAEREDERARLARVVHGELGQLLAALKMDLRWMTRKLTGSSLGLAGKLDEAEQLVDSSLAATQRMALELRPSALDTLGLAAALRDEARRFEARAGLAVEVRVSASARPSSRLATELFRIFEGLLSNVARHAAASTVWVGLVETDSEWVLSVSDDGVGMANGAADRFTALGILGMKERVRTLGGSIAFAAAPGRGTLVTVRAPWNHGQDDAQNSDC